MYAHVCVCMCITDDITDKYIAVPMSLCSYAAPLAAVRLNYKSITKLCVFHGHFNQNNVPFCDNTMLLFISDELLLYLIFVKYNPSTSIAQFLKALDRTIFVYKFLVTCDLLRVTEYHCYQGAWQQDSACCSICLLFCL